MVPGVIFVSINSLQPGETMDLIFFFFCLDLGTSSTLVKAIKGAKYSKKAKQKMLHSQ